MMSSNSETRLRAAIQKLTEAIWNLDQIELMSPEVKEEYASIQRTREKLMTLVKYHKREV
jgi:hypothetical protein